MCKKYLECAFMQTSKFEVGYYNSIIVLIIKITETLMIKYYKLNKLQHN